MKQNSNSVYIKEKGDDEIFLVNFDQKVVENRIEAEIESEEKTNKYGNFLTLK